MSSSYPPSLVLALQIVRVVVSLQKRMQSFTEGGYVSKAAPYCPVLSGVMLTRIGTEMGLVTCLEFRLVDRGILLRPNSEVRFRHEY